MFYLAIPPNVFGDAAVMIKVLAMADEKEGAWTCIVIEKPFGRDTESFNELNSVISKTFSESHLFRIDHYLGKEMVQNLQMLRFGNRFFERLWSHNDIQSVILTFKEPFGTEGRGGYFDKFGIIRDVIQNHLLQVLTLVAMEPPPRFHGPDAGDLVRDAKVQVLKAISVLTVDDCVLGQYEGYTDDDGVPDDSVTPTFACIKMFVNNPRWHGVPFILKAGKALNEKKAEIRIQFKEAPAAAFMFGVDMPQNELVLRMQPNEAIYMKTNVKSPGFSNEPIQSELEVNYNTRFKDNINPDAYTRLILDVLRGNHAAFVRADELKVSWEIFTPLLKALENRESPPIIYMQGSRGPAEVDKFIGDDYKRNKGYVYEK